MLHLVLDPYLRTIDNSSFISYKGAERVGEMDSTSVGIFGTFLSHHVLSIMTFRVSSRLFVASVDPKVHLASRCKYPSCGIL